MRISEFKTALDNIFEREGDIEVHLANNPFFCFDRKVHPQLWLIAAVTDSEGRYVMLGDTTTSKKMHERMDFEERKRH